jgi:hypothetical protein
MLSSEARMLGRTLMLTPGYDMGVDDSVGEDKWTGSTKVIYSKAAAPFSYLHSAGQYKWEGIETANNGNNEGVTFISNEPVYFALQNCHKYAIFVHAIKVTTPKQESAYVQGVSSTEAKGDAQVYGLDGKYVGTRSAKNNLAKGVYVVKQGDKAQKVIVK